MRPGVLRSRLSRRGAAPLFVGRGVSRGGSGREKAAQHPTFPIGPQFRHTVLDLADPFDVVRARNG
jgi:hypothetical protein